MNTDSARQKIIASSTAIDCTIQSVLSTIVWLDKQTAIVKAWQTGRQTDRDRDSETIEQIESQGVLVDINLILARLSSGAIWFSWLWLFLLAEYHGQILQGR